MELSLVAKWDVPVFVMNHQHGVLDAADAADRLRAWREEFPDVGLWSVRVLTPLLSKLIVRLVGSDEMVFYMEGGRLDVERVSSVIGECRDVSSPVLSMMEDGASQADAMGVVNALGL
jgi:hypothetical protein